jgi:hypothetical protein
VRAWCTYQGFKTCSCGPTPSHHDHPRATTMKASKMTAHQPSAGLSSSTYISYMSPHGRLCFDDLGSSTDTWEPICLFCLLCQRGGLSAKSLPHTRVHRRRPETQHVWGGAGAMGWSIGCLFMVSPPRRKVAFCLSKIFFSSPP